MTAASAAKSGTDALVFVLVMLLLLLMVGLLLPGVCAAVPLKCFRAC